MWRRWRVAGWWRVLARAVWSLWVMASTALMPVEDALSWAGLVVGVAGETGSLVPLPPWQSSLTWGWWCGKMATICLQVFASPDAIAIAAMSPLRVAWMVAVVRTVFRRTLGVSWGVL